VLPWKKKNGNIRFTKSYGQAKKKDWLLSPIVVQTCQGIKKKKRKTNPQPLPTRKSQQRKEKKPEKQNPQSTTAEWNPKKTGPRFALGNLPQSRIPSGLEIATSKR